MMTLLVGTNRPGSNTRKVAAQIETLYTGLKTLLRVIEDEPPGLYRGPVELIDGRAVPGILFDEATAKTHPEITALGGWKEYLGSKSDVSKS